MGVAGLHRLFRHYELVRQVSSALANFMHRLQLVFCPAGRCGDRRGGYGRRAAGRRGWAGLGSCHRSPHKHWLRRFVRSTLLVLHPFFSLQCELLLVLMAGLGCFAEHAQLMCNGCECRQHRQWLRRCDECQSDSENCSTAKIEGGGRIKCVRCINYLMRSGCWC